MTHQLSQQLHPKRPRRWNGGNHWANLSKLEKEKEKVKVFYILAGAHHQPPTG